MNEANRRELAVLVTGTQHGGEGGYLLLAARNLARLFVITLGAHVANDSFAIKLLLEAAKRTFHRLTLADLYFYGHLMKYSCNLEKS